MAGTVSACGTLASGGSEYVMVVVAADMAREGGAPTATAEGGEGTPRGTTPEVHALHAPATESLSARTRNAYSVPLRSPLTTHVVPLVVQVTPDGVDSTS